MEKSERRPISLAGLSLIGAGAVLGLALAAPAAASPGPVRPVKSDSATVTDQERLDR